MQNLFLKIKSRYHGGQNKAGKLLANYLKVKTERKSIGPIRNTVTNNLLHSDSDIVNTFQSYYNSLYMDDTHSSENDILSFFDVRPSPPSIPDVMKFLEKDILLQEILSAIKSLKRAKAPGPDGFSIELISSFSSTFAPHLLELFSSFISNFKSEGSYLDALIVIIPKPDEDHTLCQNYRPI